MLLAERSFAPLAFGLALSLAGCGGSAKIDSSAAAGSTNSAGATSSAGSANSAGATSAAGATNSAGATSSAGAASSAGSAGTASSIGGAPAVCTDDPNTTCNRASDCELRQPTCCAACEPVGATAFTAVNRTTPISNCNPNCGQCAPCGPVSPDQTTRRYFIPGCVAGQCTVVDIRKTAITECMTTSDCALRGTSRCCDGCGASETPIAYNKSVDQIAAFCGGTPTACPACVGSIAARFVAECSEGRCVVEELLK